MTALSNNLNELDVLLQDLSAARYSGHIERKETLVESKTFSSFSSYQESAPQPPERTKNKNKFVENSGTGPDPSTNLHALERTRTDSGLQARTGNEESRWQYMGLGIWENRDRSHDRSLSPSGYADPVGYRESSPGYSSTYNGYSDKYTRGTGGAGYQETIIEKTFSTQERIQPGIGFGNQPQRKSTERTERYSAGYRADEGYQVEEGASNATAELDDLMTSLNNFKMVDKQVDEPVIPPNLDTMLGNLQEDMDKQGVKTTQKGVCAACKKPIVGQVITALGYTWHPEHFTCANCNQELGTSNFFERDGKAYCEQDYHLLFSPRCGFCNGPILDKCISALDNTWHPEHFLCSGCGQQLGEEGFHEKGDSAYCKTCYFHNFAPKCGGCSQPITENYISSLNQQWHPGCFVCKECQTTFQDGNFFEHDGHPYCETHYHALRGSLCAGCHKPISGRCITAMFRKFHPEHFVCSFCLKQLNKGTFKEQGDKPYCHECFDRLFG